MNYPSLALVTVSMLSMPSMFAQAQTFEVAAIRLCPAGGAPFGNVSVSPGRLTTGCTNLATTDFTTGLIQRVYGRLPLGHTVPPGSVLPISGGPSWIYTDAYDINAAAAGNASEQVMEGPMLQALLEDRFKLKLHRETKEVPVYALTVAKGGPKLKPFKQGSCVSFDFTQSPQPALAPDQRRCDYTVGGAPNASAAAEGKTLDEFSRLLSLVLDRPVVDKTGISGNFDIHLEFALDQPAPTFFFGSDISRRPAPPLDAPPAASIFTVIQEELGLKLDPVKGPREFLVIDSIQRPSEN